MQITRIHLRTKNEMYQLQAEQALIALYDLAQGTNLKVHDQSRQTDKNKLLENTVKPLNEKKTCRLIYKR
jgi:hypothetical protein